MSSRWPVDSLIHFYCVSAEHRARRRQEQSGLVTFAFERWACCEDPLAADDHEWQAISPRTLATLIKELRSGHDVAAPFRGDAPRASPRPAESACDD